MGRQKAADPTDPVWLAEREARIREYEATVGARLGQLYKACGSKDVELVCEICGMHFIRKYATRKCIYAKSCSAICQQLLTQQNRSKNHRTKRQGG